jgi:hypothetical protein
VSDRAPRHTKDFEQLDSCDAVMKKEREKEKKPKLHTIASPHFITVREEL